MLRHPPALQLQNHCPVVARRVSEGRFRFQIQLRAPAGAAKKPFFLVSVLWLSPRFFLYLTFASSCDSVSEKVLILFVPLPLAFVSVNSGPQQRAHSNNLFLRRKVKFRKLGLPWLLSPRDFHIYTWT